MGMTIRNGGLEQGFLKDRQRNGETTPEEDERLEYLKSLPQNRYEWVDEDGERHIESIAEGQHRTRERLKERIRDAT
jgi:hypothetical protein